MDQFKWLNDGSRMSGDVHVRFCEGLGVKFPRSTRRLEFRPFGKFSNVSVESDMVAALRKLRMIVAEMNRRFAYLEKVGQTEIVPERDELNHLFVAVDEASLLYGKVSRTDSRFNNVEEARELTRDIAKRGRAAGISLILATQKVTKETIDTTIQETITGRMCFRMNTLQGSLVVLGDNSAMGLPDIPGRGIWQCGNEQVEVQAALLGEGDIEEVRQGMTEKTFFPLLEGNMEVEEEEDCQYMDSREGGEREE